MRDRKEKHKKLHRKKKEEKSTAKSSCRHTFIIHSTSFYDQRKFFMTRISVAAMRKVRLFMDKKENI